MSRQLQYAKQQTEYSCGAAAIRNALIALKYPRVPSEKSIIKIARTHKVHGTSDYKLKSALKKFGVRIEEFEGYARESAMLKWLRGELKKGRVVIATVDNEMHWLTIVGKLTRKFFVVDGEYEELPSLVTEREVIRRTTNVRDEVKQNYYYLLSVYLESPKVT